MIKRIVSGITLTILLIGMLLMGFNIKPVKTEPSTIMVPDDYSTIQEAINYANPGDTIFVSSGIYYEHVVVNKTVSLIGEDEETTIVDGEGIGIVIYVIEDSVIVSGFTIQNSGSESYDARKDSSIMVSSDWNYISGNIIRSNANYGIYISYVKHNVISENTITNNWVGVYLWSYSPSGQSRYNIVSRNNLTNNSVGIRLGQYAYYNKILDNDITNNTYTGISLSWAQHNIISGNNIVDNEYGIDYYDFYAFSDNIIYHNNFINNGILVSSGLGNVWDDGYPSGGNYWSDYAGLDLCCGPYQNETGSDDIADAPYIIDENNIDRYPLMNPLSPTPAENHDIAVTDIAPLLIVVDVGAISQVNVTILNKGNLTESFNVILFANSTVIGTQEVNNLPNGTSIALTFTWNTMGFINGNFILRAVASVVLGEREIADNILTFSSVQIIPEYSSTTILLLTTIMITTIIISKNRLRKILP